MKSKTAFECAQWIWHASDRNGWNQFIAFRREFYVSNEPNEATVAITAVSRYELYVNGVFAGKGPGRGWPEWYFYDQADVTRLLRHGRNCLAVLVHHWGVSTFQHIEMEAGLLAQMSIRVGRKKVVVGTDASWLCTPHTGYFSEAQKIHCQMAFCEIFDASAFAKGWKEAGFKENARWTNARTVKSPLPPGAVLKPLDMDPMVYQEKYPVRIAGLYRVRKPSLCMTVETRPYLCPGFSGANLCGVAGMLAFCIVSDRDVSGRIVMPQEWVDNLEACLNGRKIHFNYLDPIIPPKGVPPVHDKGIVSKTRLKRGRNYFVLKIDDFLHYHLKSFVFDFTTVLSITGPVTFKSPVILGPFAFVDSSWPDLDRACFEEQKAASDFERIWEKVSDENFLQTCSVPMRQTEWPFLSFQYAYGDVVFAQRETMDVREEEMKFLEANGSFTNVKNSRGYSTEFLIDFGQITCGYLEFDCVATRDNSLDFYFFEAYNVHANESQETFMNTTLRYFCRDGWQSFRSFVTRGGRYLRLVVRGRPPVRLYGLRIIESNAAVLQRGQYHSSDYLLNKVWDISRNTVRFCMLDTYVDCPTYEQTFWVGDSRNESLVNFYVYGNYEITRRCLLMVAKSIDRSGLPESQVPSGWNNVLTAWGEFWMMACRDYYEYTGDEKFLRKIQPELMRAAEGFAKYINADGLLDIAGWNMLDWAGMDTPTFGVVTHQNAFLVKALNDTAAMSSYCNRKNDATWASGLSKKIKISINRYLFSEERNAFFDSIHADGEPSQIYSVQTQVAVYLSDAASANRVKSLERVIVNPPVGFVKIGSPFMSFFYLEALVKAGKTELLLPYIRENWGPRMLDHGATACWEVFDVSRSHCHAWSAAPGYFLGAYILGVRPAAPGFKKVIIDPIPSDISWAKGSVPTPHGDIYVSWKRMENGKLDLNVRLPKGIEVASNKKKTEFI